MKKASREYYDHNTRSLFFIATVLLPIAFLSAITIATSVEVLSNRFGLLYPIIIFIALLVSLVFGVTKKTRKFIMITAIGGLLCTLASSTILFFKDSKVPIDIFFFWINQILLIIFLFTSYFSIQALKK